MTLVRAVPCGAPARLRKPSRAALIAPDVGRGIAVTGIVLAVMGLMVGPRRPHGCFYETKGDVARAAVMKFAYEAYPSWLQLHPGRACPRSLTELLEYMNNKDLRDPWGSTYEMLCVDEGAVLVMSRGEDGRQDTADDITSGWIGR